MKLSVAPGSPSSVVALARDVERQCVPVYPDAPIRLPVFPSTALPSAATYAHGLVWVSDLETLAASDGANWYQYTKGEPI